MKYRIEVTENDITLGLKESCVLCPVALAAKRTLKTTGIEGVIVDRDILYSRGSRAILPPRAKNFIKKFDEGKSVKPFQFKIELLYP